VLAALHHSDDPSKNKSRVSTYTDLASKYDWHNVSFPTPLNKISVFEVANNIGISVYFLNEIHKINSISLIKKASHDFPKQIELLVFRNHYIAVLSLTRLLGGMITGDNQAYVCKECGFKVFTTQAALTKHEALCKGDLKRNTYVLPKKLDLKFENVQNQFRVPFIVYADFETYFTLSNFN
jgi:hypothetical protein